MNLIKRLNRLSCKLNDYKPILYIKEGNDQSNDEQNQFIKLVKDLKRS